MLRFFNTLSRSIEEFHPIEEGKVRKALSWDMSKAGGAGSLYSTVGDLYRWNEALFGGKVLKDSTLKSAFTPVAVEGEGSGPKEEGYGYGWAIQKMRGRSEIGHGGGLNGFLSYLLRLPEERFTVIAARGGEDIWIEIRRVRENVAAARPSPGPDSPSTVGVDRRMSRPATAPRKPQMPRSPARPATTEPPAPRSANADTPAVVLPLARSTVPW